MSTSNYESDIGRFLREMKEHDPAVEAGQKQGRAIWWDKQMDPDMYRRFRESGLVQPAYAYQSKSRAK
jgi:hypothetical protein